MSPGSALEVQEEHLLDGGPHDLDDSHDASRMSDTTPITHRLLPVRRALIDTYQQPVVYLRTDCEVCRAEGFEAQAQVEIAAGGRTAPDLDVHAQTPIVTVEST